MQAQQDGKEIEESLCNFGACMLETEQEWREIAIVVRANSPVQKQWRSAADQLARIRIEHVQNCTTCRAKD